MVITSHGIHHRMYLQAVFPITLLCGTMATLPLQTIGPLSHLTTFQVCKFVEPTHKLLWHPLFLRLDPFRAVWVFASMWLSFLQVLRSCIQLHTLMQSRYVLEILNAHFWCLTCYLRIHMSLIHWLLNVLVHGCSLYPPSLEYISPIAIEYSCFGFIATRICSYM